MSGHSHSANIKRKKEATDAKKGAVFGKVARLITTAVKEGGGVTDPERNSRLRIALDKAKAINMPKENIQRAISKGTGETGRRDLESVVYEGFGPAGTAVMVRCLTDNKNRTGAEIKNLLERMGGRLAERGAAAHFFEKKGFLKVKKESKPEEQILHLIDLGVEDVEEEGSFLAVYVPPSKLAEFRTKITDAKFTVEEAEQVIKSKTRLSIDQKNREKLKKFIETLKSYDDVQRVFVNVEI